MFTGIVRELGEVGEVERREGAGARLLVRTSLADELAAGDSVAVSGVCLTAATVAAGAFEADVTNQTLQLTTLGALASNDRVNLEPALRAGDPFGGHIVQGHVDATAAVTAAVDDGISRRLAVAMPASLRRYVVERGSVALDGVSLTVAALTDEGFEAALIPETLARTTLGRLAPGSVVNLEVDLIARYAERLLQTTGNEGRSR
jgi:riboflavin synthase